MNMISPIAAARPRDASEQVQSVSTGLGPLNVRIVGSGPEPLVLWPSIFADSHIFDALAKALSDLCTVVLIDGPGHGGSPGTASEFSMKDCAEAMLAVMDELDLPQATVGGVSWGGLVAAEVALTHPDRVRSVVIMNAPMDVDGRHPKFADRMISLGARWMLGTGVYREGVAKSFFGPGGLDKHPDYAPQFHAMLKNANPLHLAAAVRSVILRGSPLRPRLSELRVPTLLIAGVDDQLYPLEQHADAALRIANCRFEPVPGGHISSVDAPEEVATFIRALVNREAAR